VIQSLAAGAEARKTEIVAALAEALSPDGILERSDAPVREREGLPVSVGVLSGSVPDRIEIRENGLGFAVDLAVGQKTGWFLDQRENRAAASVYASGRRVLDAFCNAGGFGLCAAAAGATSVLAVDSSESAVAQVKDNARRNGFRKRWKPGKPTPSISSGNSRRKSPLRIDHPGPTRLRQKPGRSGRRRPRL
jgi:23S rRNA (cytosine1962-C5)-methyltransferase